MNRHLLAASAAAILCMPMMASAQTASDVTASPPPAATAPMAPAPTAPDQLAPHGDIIGTLKASGQFTILAKALDATNMTSVLQGPGPITLIAPTDAAFQALPAGTLAMLMKPENAQQLQSLLAYHLINTNVPLSKIEGAKGPVQTVNGAKVVVDGSTQPIKFNDADVTATSTTTNGAIYVVDKVLSPNPPRAEAKLPASEPQLAANADTSAAAIPGEASSAAVNTQAAAPSATDSAMPASATTPAADAAPAPASGTDQVASAPVPDTAANRAKYGAPLSHAGRTSQPAGN